MCLTLMFKVFGASLFFQGCLSGEPTALPQKADSVVPPVTTEEWAPIIAKADPEEDGTVTYLFRDAAGRVRPAVALCGDDVPKEEDKKVMITKVQHKDVTAYSVSCMPAPKVM
jgi:hypothetical protein